MTTFSGHGLRFSGAVLLTLAAARPGLTAEERRSTVLTPYRECLMAQVDLDAFLAEHPESDDESLVGRVSRIGQEIARMSDRPDFDFDFRVFRGSGVEAHSFTGGAVVVSEEAVRFLDDDHELAFFIGHEVAHFALRHPVNRIRVATALHHGPDGGKRAARRDEATKQDIGWEQEREADQYGALYAVRAGYRFSASHEAFERVARGFPELAVADEDHPALADRIEALRTFRTELDRAIDHFHSGLEAHRAGRSDDAIRHLRIFCDQFPNSVAGNVNLGAAYLARLRQGGAPEGLAEPLPILPDPGVAIRGRRPSRRDLDAARASFERALRKVEPTGDDPGHAMTLAGLGMVHLWEARLLSTEESLDRAQRYLERARTVDPESAEILLCLGNTAYVSGDVPVAERRFREALRVRPGWHEATKNLALAIELAGRPCDTRPLWESLVKSPYAAEAAGRLADLQAGGGCR